MTPPSLASRAPARGGRASPGGDPRGGVMRRARRGNLRFVRWVVLAHLAMFGGLAVRYGDRAAFTGEILRALSAVAAFTAAALAYAAVTAGRRGTGVAVAGGALAVSVWLVVTGLSGSALRPYYDQVRMPVVPAPWPVTIGATAVLAGALAWLFGAAPSVPGWRRRPDV